MSKRSLIAAVVIAGAALIVTNGAKAEGVQYPDWTGQWERFVVPGIPGQPSHDQTKPWGFGQQAPLTPEYRKILEDSIADQATGGLGNFPTAWGRAAGMPYMMMAFGPLEWVVTPKTTYILIAWHDHLRRIFTDGREWPDNIEPTFAGYSIGRWIDEDGDGIYDVLEVETRGFKGPRAVDETGLPMHVDNQHTALLERRFEFTLCCNRSGRAMAISSRSGRRCSLSWNPAYRLWFDVLSPRSE